MITVLAFLLFIIATSIFITCFVDLWQEVGEDMFSDTRKKVTKWYKGTRLFMWVNNQKNRVKVLSEKEYLNLLAEGKIKYVVLEEEG